jgi:hypothetical protein
MPLRITKSSLWPSLRAFKLPGKGQGMEENKPEDFGVLPERPQRAVPFIKRGATQEEIDNQLLPSFDMSSDTLVSAALSLRGA